MAIFKIGDLISFSYESNTKITDPYPQVFVLHTGWRRREFPKEEPKVHGLAFNVLSDSEINYIKAVINPTFAAEIIKTDQVIKQQLTSIGLLGPTPRPMKVDSPFDFYNRFVKQFIRKYDSYRLYTPAKMKNIKIITKREVMIGSKPGFFSNYMNKFKNLGK